MMRIGDINERLMVRAAEACDGAKPNAQSILAAALQAIDTDQSDAKALEAYVVLIGHFHDDLVEALFSGEVAAC
ncbi:hypothetical protein [Rhizobium sp. CC-YZS058]|uniref:hypothetical protein n=1 Tax=Rhizobium sp. CC-YZS058 TaxID=3042153 RepID=UPI002B053311|nr:hypothetical protein [Rhizobium sp. CC-YZS058]MEA3533688.1 hypothetical protein [Rhizobium sp. CC-YZS058]